VAAAPELPPLPDEAFSPPVPVPPATQETASERSPISISHSLELTSLAYLGDIPRGADPLWLELEYQPRVTAPLMGPLSATGEVLIRASETKRSIDTQLHSRAEGGSEQTPEFHPLVDRMRVALKEAYINFAGPLELAVGWQILSWGHADGLKPLDIFERNDSSDFLRREALGVPALTATHGGEHWALELVLLLDSPVDELAQSPRNLWAFLPRDPELPPVRLDMSREHAGKAFQERGARFTWNGQDWDLSVMAAQTRDRIPTLFELSLSESELVLRPDFYRYSMVGASAVHAMGQFLLRAEGMYAWYEREVDYFVRNGFRGVAGIETHGSLGAYDRYTVILQYVVDDTARALVSQSDEQVSSPFRVYRQAATAALLATFSEQYHAELRAFAELDHGGIISSLKLKYVPRDGLALWLAGSVLTGKENTWLGRVQAADNVSAGVEIHTN
jgi:hypothetical protein